MLLGRGKREPGLQAAGGGDGYLEIGAPRPGVNEI